MSWVEHVAARSTPYVYLMYTLSISYVLHLCSTYLLHLLCYILLDVGVLVFFKKYYKYIIP